MEQKNRLVFAVAVILLIFAALFVSFGRIIFRMDTPSVSLPSVNVSQPGDSSGTGEGPSPSGQTVSVTTRTVQSVIATLHRADSYYREISVEQFWASGGTATAVQIWSDGGWNHSFRELPNGAGRHDLVGDGTAYYWYNGSSRYLSTPADDRSDDLTQRLPTYETVLELSPDTITAAGYELKNDIPCIYVESTDTDTVLRYWVGVDSGLLVSAEMLRADEVIYRMTSSSIQSPCPAGAIFRLPDGTILHNP